MKSVPLFLLTILIGTLTLSSDLVFTCDGYKTTFKQNLNTEEIPSLRERMKALIKNGSIPIVIEGENNVAWIYLNDPEGRDYPDIDFESNYFEIIQDLFPLKINKELQKSLKKGNKAFLKTLGIEYIIEGEDVISKINYKVFEKFMF